jgi:hypothetical protein
LTKIKYQGTVFARKSHENCRKFNTKIIQSTIKIHLP